jgi:hypothetical protein
LPVVPVNHALDTVSKMDNVEIDQQSDFTTAQPHVLQELCLVYGIDRFHAFDLDNHEIVNDEVNSISEVDLLAIVEHWQSDLTGDRESLLSKFV